MGSDNLLLREAGALDELERGWGTSGEMERGVVEFVCRRGLLSLLFRNGEEVEAGVMDRWLEEA